MTLEEFTKQYSLRTVSAVTAAKRCQALDGKPKCDVEHVPGGRGWIRTGQHSFQVFVKFTRNFGPVMAEMSALGFKGAGRGDYEVMRTFDPGNETQANYAIRVIRARHRRQVSEAQRQRGRELAAKFSLRKDATGS